MEHWQLKQRQSLPLDAKIAMSKTRIREWYNYWQGDVYVSFSGGKDSTVLLNLIRSMYPEVPTVFVNTGLEYPEIVEFVKTIDNVTTIRPTKGFYKIIKEYGYPVVSKKVARQIRDLQNPTDTNQNSRKLYLTGIKMDGTKSKSFKLAKKWVPLALESGIKVSEKCCDFIKKEPIKRYNKETGYKSYVGTMASDSMQRKHSYMQTGCNSFDGSSQKSMPLSFWLESDIWDYIKLNNLPYSTIYDTGVKRTGCIWCMFGVHLEKEPNRFQRMQITHPREYKYCMEKLGLKEVLEYINVPYENERVLFK